MLGYLAFLVSGPSSPFQSKRPIASEVRSIPTNGRAESVIFDSSSTQLCISTTTGIQTLDLNDKALPKTSALPDTFGTISVLRTAKQFAVYQGGVIYTISQGRVISRQFLMLPDLVNSSVAVIVSPDQKFANFQTRQFSDIIVSLPIGHILRVYNNTIFDSCCGHNAFPLIEFKIGADFYAPDYDFAHIRFPLKNISKPELNGCTTPPISSTFCQRSCRLYCSCANGDLICWQLPRLMPKMRVTSLRQCADALAISPNGKLLAYGFRVHRPHNDKKRDSNGLLILDGDNGQILQRIDSSSEVFRLAFSPDGRYLAEADRRGVVRIFRIEASATK